MEVAKQLESRTELTDLCIRRLFSQVCQPELTDPYVLVYLGADLDAINGGGAQNVFLVLVILANSRRQIADSCNFFLLLTIERQFTFH